MTEEKNYSETNKDVDRFDQWADHYEQSIMQRLYFRHVHATMLHLLTEERPELSPTSILDIGLWNRTLSAFSIHCLARCAIARCGSS